MHSLAGHASADRHVGQGHAAVEQLLHQASPLRSGLLGFNFDAGKAGLQSTQLLDGEQLLGGHDSTVRLPSRPTATTTRSQ